MPRRDAGQSRESRRAKAISKDSKVTLNAERQRQNVETERRLITLISTPLTSTKP